MTVDDPWSHVEPPKAADTVNARRVEDQLRWGFFWAKGIDRRCMLILQHADESSCAARLPRIRGIDVTLSEPDEQGQRMLALKLLETQHRDIFLKLCRDVICSAANAASEAEVVDRFLARTWRWHHLLRGGSSHLLSVEEQKGLIGELLVLNEFLIPVIGVRDSVAAWRGPTGAPKDFEIGRICVEVKARRGASRPFVAISSEDQLETEGTDGLFLYVVDLDVAPGNIEAAFSLTDVARKVQGIVDGEAAAVEMFEQLLIASGFDWEDDYSDFIWLSGPHKLLKVGQGFPLITRSMLPAGVSKVRYEISLNECVGFRVEDEVLKSMIEEGGNGA